MSEYRHPITFEVMDDQEKWTFYARAKAKVNSFGGKEALAAGAIQADETLQFEVRYCKQYAALNAQTCRIVFAGRTYDVKYIDDYMYRHKALKFRGVGKLGRCEM